MDAVVSPGRWRHHRVRLWVGAALLVTTVAGCGSATGEVQGKQTPTHESSSTSAPSPAPPPPRCQAWECRTRQTVNLTLGWTVRLWLSGDQQNYDSRPVVELLHNGVAVQWWISPRGDGWNGSLTCLTGG